VFKKISDKCKNVLKVALNCQINFNFSQNWNRNLYFNVFLVEKKISSHKQSSTKAKLLFDENEMKNFTKQNNRTNKTY